MISNQIRESSYSYDYHSYRIFSGSSRPSLWWEQMALGWFVEESRWVKMLILCSEALLQALSQSLHCPAYWHLNCSTRNQKAEKLSPFHSLYFCSPKNNTTSSPGFLGQRFNNRHRAALLTSFWRHLFNMAKFLTSSVQYDKVLSKFGQQRLVMVNYACGFIHSEAGIYFEWIIIEYIELASRKQ